MHPVLLSFGPVSVYAWGALLSLAVLVGIFGTRKLARQDGLPVERIIDLIILVVLAGLLGARLFYVFFYDWAYYSANPGAIFNFNQPGLVFYGGLIGGVAAGAGYIACFRLPFWRIADVFAPFLALGYGIVRIGCFLNGCCHGKISEMPWGVVFPGLLELPRHPTQLYSAFLAFALFAFLLWLFYHRRFSGQVFLLYLILYAVIRALVEVFRENLIIWGPITIAQVVSIIVLIIASWVYWYRRKQTS